MSQVKITNTTQVTIQVPGRAGIRVPGKLSIQVNTNCIDRHRATSIFGLRIDDVSEHVDDGQQEGIPVQSTVIQGVHGHVEDLPAADPVEEVPQTPIVAAPVRNTNAGPSRRRGRRRKDDEVTNG